MVMVIIPCGGKKQSRKTIAANMYTGSYFRACLRFARSIVPDNDILILSAKYGFLRLDTVIAPYDVTFNEKYAPYVSLEILRQQARSYDCDVIALGGKEYVDRCRILFSHCITPLQGIGGMGKQMQWLKQNAGKYRIPIQREETT